MINARLVPRTGPVTVGQAVKVYNINQRNREPLNGTVTRVGRVLCTVTYGRGSGTFRIDTGTINDKYGHEYFRTVPEAEQAEQLARSLDTMRDHGITVRGGNLTPAQAAGIAAILTAVPVSAELAPLTEGKTVELEPGWQALYEEAVLADRAATRQRDKLTAQLLDLMGDAEYASSDGQVFVKRAVFVQHREAKAAQDIPSVRLSLTPRECAQCGLSEGHTPNCEVNK